MNTGDALDLDTTKYSRLGVWGADSAIYQPYEDAVSLWLSDRMMDDLDARFGVFLSDVLRDAIEE